MGLDQYAYIASKADTEYNDTSRQELAYWRKHPNLQGWMERLWLKKQGIPIFEADQFIEDKQPRDFNGVELELTWKDIDCLEQDIINGVVANLDTVGFFFGNASDSYYHEQDLNFCRDAKSHIFFGRKVFYNSSW